jgi:hypothetical protein
MTPFVVRKMMKGHGKLQTNRKQGKVIKIKKLTFRTCPRRRHLHLPNPFHAKRAGMTDYCAVDETR